MEQTPRLLRPRDAAAYTGFRKSSLDKFRCSGSGPRFIRRGSAIFYAREDLDSWLESMPRFASTSEADTAETRTANEEEPES